MEEAVFDVWDISGTRVTECLLPGLEGGYLKFRISRGRMLIYMGNTLHYQRIYIVEIHREGISGE